MSKLPKQHKFVDLSDYGRTVAIWIARRLKHTSVTPVHVTGWFFIAGLLAVACIYYAYFFLAGLLLIVKSILDAADGELSRVKQTPSYTGRYLDSIADIALNFLILFIIGYVTHTSYIYVLLAFIGMQLQGTLYNYYYVILRNKHSGDTTSRIFETEPPTALPGERQQTVNQLFHIYNTLYIIFDKAIYYLDPRAAENDHLPRWFMTGISIFGLGFQLLQIAILLNLGAIFLILPSFIVLTLTLPLIVLLRKLIS